jgi:hypothetical protein
MGRIAAVRVIPALPSDCRIKEQHVVIHRSTADPWSLLAFEGEKLDKQDSRTDRCSAFYDHMKASQEAATK